MLEGEAHSLSAGQTGRTGRGSQGAPWPGGGLPLPFPPPWPAGGGLSLRLSPPAPPLIWGGECQPRHSALDVPSVSAKGEPPPHTRKIEFWKALCGILGYRWLPSGRHVPFHKRLLTGPSLWPPHPLPTPRPPNSPAAEEGLPGGLTPLAPALWRAEPGDPCACPPAPRTRRQYQARAGAFKQAWIRGLGFGTSTLG